MTYLFKYFYFSSNDHFKYSAHFCSNAFKNNVQVPECPLCGMPVPIPRNQQPDVAVGAHIDRDCRWDPSKERKVQLLRCFLFFFLEPNVSNACFFTGFYKQMHSKRL